MVFTRVFLVFCMTFNNINHEIISGMADFYLENCTHEEAVNALKKCKEKVTFVVDKAEQHYPSSPTIGKVQYVWHHQL